VKRLRVVFFGMGGDFMLRPLLRIALSHDVVGLVLARGKATKLARLMSCVRHILLRLQLRLRLYFLGKGNMPILEFDKSKQHEIIGALHALCPDLFCVAGFPCLLKPEVFSIAPLGCINMHPSLLPAYRGPSPYFWIYYNHEPRTGVTIHRIDAGEDSGDILAQESVEVPLGLPGAAMLSTIRDLGAHLMEQVVNDVANNQVRVKANPHNSPTCRARRPDSKVEYVDWQNWPVRRVFHFLKGVMPNWYTPPALKGLGIGKKYYLSAFVESNHVERPLVLVKESGEYKVFCLDGWLVFKPVTIRMQLERLLRKVIKLFGKMNVKTDLKR